MFRDYKIDEIEPTRRVKLIHDLEVNLRTIDAIEVQEVNRLYPLKISVPRFVNPIMIAMLS